MVEKPYEGRAKVVNRISGLEVVIPSKMNVFITLFLCAWMGGWVMGESFAIGSLFNDDIPVFANTFLLFWLTGWTIGGGFVIYTILWQIAGKERVVADRGLLEISKGVSFLSRKKTYDISSIRNLDVQPQDTSTPWGRNRAFNVFGSSSGVVKFDYGMKTIRFGISIEEAEGRHILGLLRSDRNFTEENFAQKS